MQCVRKGQEREQGAGGRRGKVQGSEKMERLRAEVQGLIQGQGEGQE